MKSDNAENEIQMKSAEKRLAQCGNIHCCGCRDGRCKEEK